MSLFQRSLLGVFAGGLLLIAFVIAAKGPAAAALVPPTSVATTVTGDTNGGIARGLVTTGVGYLKVRPDMVEISLGVVAQADTAAAAQSAVADREARILQRARDLGVPEVDTKTAVYRIDPQYAYEQGKAPRIAGYQAQETVIVTIRDVAATGKALDLFVQDDGATTATIRFGLADAKPSQARSRDLAIADARAKAEAMAKAAGVKLGKIVAIADALVGPQTRVDSTTFSQLVKSPATQVPVNDLDVNVSVQVQFETE